MAAPSRKHLWILTVLTLMMLAACAEESEPAPETEETPPADTMAMEQPAQPAVPGTKINLNTATSEDFLTIPDVGDRMVHEFMEYRPYVSIQQFRREIGKYVDEDQVAAYEQYVFVPVNPNESDAETVQQLPGVEADEAAELIAGRPYASREAFLEKLGDYVSAEELTTAESYLKSL